MRLSDRQRELLDRWMPDATIVRDHSWGLVGTYVLELEQDGERYIAKAGDDADHHLARELRAHRNWLRPWTAQGSAAELVQADEDAKLLLTRFLPGELVEGTPYEWAPDTYRQAGELLRSFHAQSAVPDDDYEVRENERLLKHLSRPHRIAPEVVDRLRTTIARWPTPPAVLVPTHGDWQPRNWLIDGGTVRVIDFGRAALRPAYTISLGWRSSSSSAILLSSPRSSPATAPIHASRARGTAIASARRSVRLSGRTRSATTRTNGRATG